MLECVSRHDVELMHRVPDQKLKVEFDPPEDGWTGVGLSAGGCSYGFSPSHVPYDSFGDLVCALLKILDGRHDAVVRWNDEPVEHEFVFASDGRRVDFRVFEIVVSAAGRTREERFAFGGPAYKVLWPFWKALREMQSRQSSEEYARRWREPFPEREMVELTRRIKAMKSDGADDGGRP